MCTAYMAFRCGFMQIYLCNKGACWFKVETASHILFVHMALLTLSASHNTRNFDRAFCLTVGRLHVLNVVPEIKRKLLSKE